MTTLRGSAGTCARRAIVARALTLEQIAYDNALRALDKQEHAAEELRARTGVLLAASSLIGSLLGPRAFEDGRPLALIVVALTALVVSLIASAYVLAPQGLYLSLDATALYERLIDLRDEVDEVHRHLAYDLRQFWAINDAALRPSLRAVRVAAWSVAIEIVALTVLTVGILP